MFAVETLSALISTDRTPLAAGPTATRNDQPCAPSSATLSATPPPLGRRKLSEMFWKFHLLPRCSSSTIRLPFFKPISLRFCPSSPVRLRLSSQSRPASNPLDARTSEGAAAVAGCGDAGTAEDPADGGPPGNGGVAPAVRFEAIPVASGRALSPVETVT